MGAAKEGTLVENRTGKEALKHQKTGKRAETTKLPWKAEDLEVGRSWAVRGPYCNTAGCFMGLQRKRKKY